MTTPELFFGRATNRLFASDYVLWAISMLEREFDSPSLRILAGLNGNSIFEADDYLRRVMRELNISEPDFATSIGAYACELASRIVVDDIDPKEAVRSLYQLCLAANHAQDFMIWCELDEALDDIEAGRESYMLMTGNFDETVRTEAKRFLESACHTDRH